MISPSNDTFSVWAPRARAVGLVLDSPGAEPVPMRRAKDGWWTSGVPREVGRDYGFVLTGDDDHWYSPYAHKDLVARDAGFRAYLSWELGLVAQLEREGNVGIRLMPAP